MAAHRLSPLKSKVNSAATQRLIRSRYHLAGVADVTNEGVRLRRSYLYVPASSDRMLQKSVTNPSDVIIYDLEDSIAPSARDKKDARDRLTEFLSRICPPHGPDPERIAVRINSTSTPFFEADIAEALRIPSVRTLVLPKVNSVQVLHAVSRAIAARGVREPVHLVASIESARALWDIGEIARWTSTNGVPRGGVLSALLFAAEDYCADTSIIRTTSRQELLYARSKIAAAAKAFRLEAIDMVGSFFFVNTPFLHRLEVCVNYKDLNYLKEECQDGRRLGYTGKQAIHPSQVKVIQSTFVPTSEEIMRAAKIVHLMAQTHAAQRGAVGLDVGDGKGGKEEIDAPMLKQAVKTVELAQAAGLNIPRFD
ncbi:beta subunit of citrate lyase [Dentipellis sp. KUC8613]|nr:beta subunit of citrate lyase [Dentipellis sp. KUC8613]